MVRHCICNGSSVSQWSFQYFCEGFFELSLCNWVLASEFVGLWPLKTWHEQNVFSFHMCGVQLFPSPLCFCFAFIFPVWIVGGDRSISANASPTQLLKGILLSKTDFFCFFVVFLPNNPCLLLAVDHQNKLTKSVNGPSKTVWTINH